MTMKFRTARILFAADSGGNDGGGDPQNDDTGNDDDGEEDSPDFDTWLSEQPDNIKDMFDNHVDGLRNTMRNERNERKELAKQLEKLTKKASKGDDLQDEIKKLSSTLEEADRKADFYEAAGDHGIKNLSLAYLAAKHNNLFDDDGEADFAKLKEVAPEVFLKEEKKPTPKGNAGTGQGQGGQTAPSMNDFIRASAGRQ